MANNNTNGEEMGILALILTAAMISAEIIVISLIYKFGLLLWHDVTNYTDPKLGITIANLISVIMGVATAIAIPILAIKIVPSFKKEKKE